MHNNGANIIQNQNQTNNSRLSHYSAGKTPGNMTKPANQPPQYNMNSSKQQ
jgi:hypothetical protein